MNHVVVWFLGYVGSAADSRPCPTYHPAHGSRLARLGQDGARRVVRPSRCALLGRSSHRPTMRRVRAAHSGRQRMRGGRTRWPRVRSSRVPYGVVARVTGPAREAGLHRPFVSGFAPRGRRTRPAAADAPAPEVSFELSVPQPGARVAAADQTAPTLSIAPPCAIDTAVCDVWRDWAGVIEVLAMGGKPPLSEADGPWVRGILENRTSKASAPAGG